MDYCRPIVKSVYQKNTFLFLIQNICSGYSKEPHQYDGSFDHPKHMLKHMAKKNNYNFTLKIFVYLNLWISPYHLDCKYMCKLTPKEVAVELPHLLECKLTHISF